MELEWLISYELRKAARHRHFVSVVLMAPCEEKISMAQLLKNTVRASDQLFTLNGESAVLMPYTSKYEARKAAERYRSMCNGEVDVRYSIASYPGDGGAVADILKTAEQRLKQAKRAGFGAIVTAGPERPESLRLNNQSAMPACSRSRSNWKLVRTGSNWELIKDR